MMQHKQTLLSNPGPRPLRLFGEYIPWGLACLCLAAPLLLLVRPVPEIAYFPLSEDGYYVLSVARNIALGHGITYDGVTPTNGFHPLFTLLCTIAYLLSDGDLWQSLPLVLALHWAVYAAGAILFSKVIAHAAGVTPEQHRRLAAWSCFWYAAAVPILINSFNGLETGLTLLLALSLLRASQLLHDAPRPTSIFIGALFGLLILARIDNAAWAAFYTAMRACRRQSWRNRFSEALLTAMPAILISGPWWLYNYFLFGSPLPSSAEQQIEAALSGGRLAAAASAALQNFLLVLYPTTLAPLKETIVWAAMGMVLFAALAAAAGFSIARIGSGRRPTAPLWRTSAFHGVLLSFLLHCIFLGVWYGFFSRAIHYYPRYLIYYALLGAAAAAAITAAATVKNRAIAVIVILCSIFYTGWYLAQESFHARSPYLDQVALIEEHVPPHEAVGAAQSGTAGYFLDNIVNLDGKVNSEALRAHRGGRISAYIHRRGITWLCDWEWVIKDLIKDDKRPGEWRSTARRGSMTLYRFSPR